MNNKIRNLILDHFDETDFYLMVVVCAAIDNLAHQIKHNEEKMCDLYGDILLKAIKELDKRDVH